MLCPHCGAATRVQETRPRRVDASHGSGSLQAHARRTVGASLPDWVARRRVCTDCGSGTLTLEVTMTELRENWTPPTTPTPLDNG